MKELTEAILRVREDFLSKRALVSSYDINSGLCEEFAEAVLGLLGPQAEMRGVQGFWDDDFREVLGASRWDRVVMDRWGIEPPTGVSWELLDRIPPGIHYSIASEPQRMFFDAEAPEGVRSIFDLPFFQRYIRHFQRRGSLPS